MELEPKNQTIKRESDLTQPPLCYLFVKVSIFVFFFLGGEGRAICQKKGWVAICQKILPNGCSYPYHGNFTAWFLDNTHEGLKEFLVTFAKYV